MQNQDDAVLSSPPEVAEPEIEVADTQNQAALSLSLESLIKTHFASIEKLEKELKEARETLDNIFTNEALYKEHSERAKEATKIKSATKQQILNRPDVRRVSEQVKTLKTELSDQKTTLSDLLQEFQKASGMNEVEVGNGEIREIIFTAKLARKSPR